MAVAVDSFSLEYPCGTRQDAHWLIPGPIPYGMGPFDSLISHVSLAGLRADALLDSVFARRGGVVGLPGLEPGTVRL